MTSDMEITLPIQIKLDPWEFKHCVDVANIRMAISNERDMNHSSTYERGYVERIRQETLGVCGEMAVCKAINKMWKPTVNTFHNVPDVEPNIEVRSTENTNGSLIIRENDDDNRWYFLVIGEPPNVTVVGYIWGANAKQDQWIKNPNGYRTAWFVPQDALLKTGKRASTDISAGTDTEEGC